MNRHYPMVIMACVTFVTLLTAAFCGCQQPEPPEADWPSVIALEMVEYLDVNPGPPSKPSPPDSSAGAVRGSGGAVQDARHVTENQKHTEVPSSPQGGFSATPETSSGHWEERRAGLFGRRTRLHWVED